MPIRDHWRPVINDAREHEQTGQALYQVVRTLPLNASLSICGVLVVGWPVKPVSP